MRVLPARPPHRKRCVTAFFGPDPFLGVRNSLKNQTAIRAGDRFVMIAANDTLANVLASYRAGKAASDAELARLSAIERKAVLAIKAVGTAAAKQAAFAGISWGQAF